MMFVVYCQYPHAQMFISALLAKIAKINYFCSIYRLMEPTVTKNRGKISVNESGTPKKSPGTPGIRPAKTAKNQAAVKKGTGASRKSSGTSKRKSGKAGKRIRKIKLGTGTMIGTAAGILATVMAFVLIFHIPRISADKEYGAKVPSGQWRYGIDISHNNEGRIVWDSLFVMTDSKGRTVRDPYKAKEIKPVSFVFIKATEGGSFKDRNFKDNWKAAGRTGLIRGAYHFFRSSKDGEVQARHFIATVGELRRNDLPPVLDIETIHRGCSDKLLNDRALQWLRAVEKHYGRKPIVYSGASFAKDHLCKEIRENYPIWIAHYKKDRPAYEGWTLWQFTDQAVVKGVPGLVDLNVMKNIPQEKD